MPKSLSDWQALWQQQGQCSDYQKARALLRRYVGYYDDGARLEDWPLVQRLCHGHFRRHHVAAVNYALKAYAPDSLTPYPQTVWELLRKLASKLEVNKLDKAGDLSHILAVIKAETGYGLTVNNPNAVITQLRSGALTRIEPEHVEVLKADRAALHEVMTTSVTLEHINLSASLQQFNGNKGEIFTTICKAVKQLRSLRSLDLSDNQLTSAQTEALCQALAANPLLSDIKLGGSDSVGRITQRKINALCARNKAITALLRKLSLPLQRALLTPGSNLATLKTALAHERASSRLQFFSVAATSDNHSSNELYNMLASATDFDDLIAQVTKSPASDFTSGDKR